MQKKLLSALISLSVLSSAMPATFAAPAECESEKPAVYSDVSLMNIIDDGTCGDGITWTLDDAGTLTISGTGGDVSV